jgi:hypothetical protein
MSEMSRGEEVLDLTRAEYELDSNDTPSFYQPCRCNSYFTVYIWPANGVARCGVVDNESIAGPTTAGRVLAYRSLAVSSSCDCKVFPRPVGHRVL